MSDNKEKDTVKKTIKRELKFTMGDMVDFDALIKKKGIVLVGEKKLDKQD